MKKRLLTLIKTALMVCVLLCLCRNTLQAATPREKLNPFAQVVVKGTIKDQEGNALAGATVSQKGDRNPVVANDKGEFTITVDDNATLVISFVGFETQSIELNGRKEINVIMARQTISNTEVVVTALGIRKEKNKISYATQEVKGASLEKAPESNVANNLVGKVAGLNIITKTNLFENPEILLRGAATLVVIDGVPTNKDNFDFWNLNANDIESINVLKGTAAAALYGALGINGAIMITTKKGKSGAKGVEVTYNTTTQFQTGFLKIPKTQDQYGMGYGGYYAFIDGKSGGGWADDYGYVWGPKLNVKNSANPSGYEEYPQYNSPYDPNNTYPFTQGGYSDVSHYKPLPWISRGKNNLKNFLNNELITTHNVAIAGKNENADYRISLTHMYQKGQVPNTKLNSTTVTISGGLKVTNKFKLESTLSYNRQYTPNYPQTGYGANNFFYNILLWMGPDVDIRNLRNYWQPAGGRFDNQSNSFINYGVKNVQQFNYNYTWYNNPWYLAYEALNGYTNDVITGQVNGTYDFTKDLSLFVRSGVITNSSLSSLKTPKSYIYYGNGEFDGNYSEKRLTNFQIVTDALLTYKKTFLRNFNATVSVGASSRYTSANNLNSQTNGLNVPVNYNLGNSKGAVVTTNRSAEKKVNSAFGYVDVDYKKMIFVGFTGRNDATTTLQKPNNSYFYPSASIGVIPTSMIKFPDVISYIKFRGSWAKVSTDNITLYNDFYRDWYATTPVYETGPRWNGNNASLNLPGALIQSNIRPNTTISQEYGAELRFLKNRIGIDFTYFTYIDKDFAKATPISSASGYNSLFVNSDKFNRKGIELVLSATAVKTKDFRWDMTANYSTVHTYVKEYFGGEKIRDGIKIGERTDVFRGWDWERSPDGKIVYFNNIGFPKYIDHVVNIGRTDADFIFGITNNFSYKNLSISFSFDGRIGGVMYNGLEQKLYEGGMHPATANSYRDDSYAGKATYTGD
ncbi:MAG: SusC/RagA family TonB-linked outer membrane protein [Sphingobacteriales bacterium]|nr:SusC/RagA family TonB-linked outer membrane protein [Sphingobacteriales bacterium]